MIYKDNILTINDKNVEFEHPIKEVQMFKDIYIVLISPKDKYECPLNVFAVNNNGKILWRIKNYNNKNIIYNSIDIDLEKNRLFLQDIDYFKYLVDFETGEIISGKVKPLEFENNVKKPSEISKEIDFKKYINTKNLLIICIIVILFSFFSISGKNLKISSLEKQLQESQQLNTTLESTLVKQEQLISQYEQKIIEYENFINSINNTIQTKQEVEVIEEQIPEEKNEIKEGVSSLVGIIDSVISNVSSGTPQTIQDVQEKSTTINDSCVTEIIDGTKFKLKIDDKEETVKLISVTNCKKETLEALIPVGTKVYIETDSKKYNDAGELLAYVWVIEPDTNKLNSMVNYVILTNGYGKFENEVPNIKYNRFFF